MTIPEERWRPGDPVSPVEEKLLEQASDGAQFDGLDGSGKTVSLAIEAVSQRPTIRAAVLRHLLTESEWSVAQKGVRLRRTRISGLLDLEAATIRCPLMLEDCDLDDPRPIALDFATIPLLVLARCRLTGISADSITVLGNLSIEGSLISGTVKMGGARIGGALIFSAAHLGADSVGNSLFCHGMNVRLSVHIRNGFISDGAVIMPRVDIGGELICRDSRLGANPSRSSLSAAGLRVGGAAYLSGGFTAEGAVLLTGATIGGQLRCDGADIAADTAGNSLLCDGIRTGGSVTLDRGPDDRPFKATGAVRLAGAQITGSLTCRGASLGANRYGNALVGDELTTSVAVLLEDGFTATGAIRLPGATIGGQVRCTDSKITGTDSAGFSFVGDGARIGGPAHLDAGFESAGAVGLPGANIAGLLSLAGAKLGRCDLAGDSLMADGTTIGGSVHLDNHFTATGTVRLSHASLSGSVHCSGARLGSGAQHKSLVAEQVTVGGSIFLDCGLEAAGSVSLDSSVVLHELRWQPGQPPAGEVTLQGARTHYLTDDWTSPRTLGFWPPGRLRLAGFTYSGFGGDQPATVTQRVAWLRSQYLAHPGDASPGSGSGRTASSRTGNGASETGNPARPQPPTPAPRMMPFNTQPYRQLADVYRQAGQIDEAVTVEIAMRRDTRRYGNITRQRKVLNWILDIAIRYGFRTGRALAGIAILYLAVFAAAIVAQHQGDLIIASSNSDASLHPTALRCVTGYPCFYPAGYAFDLVVPIINIHQADHWQLNGHHLLGWVWVLGSWLATALGWFLATLLVVGYSGIAKHE
jgi:NDP-sugar pyrophosphorylase family protein